MRTPKFIYFDLGNVLANFSVDLMLDQLAAVAGIDRAQVHQELFGNHLQRAYELGRVTTCEFYERFCGATGTCCAMDDMIHAASAMFELNWPMVPVVAHLHAAGYRLGILSNTCEGHWQYCYDRWRILRDCFEVYALSYEIHACKPDPAIFREAARQVDVAEEDIYYTDDLDGHVTAAEDVGFDAHVFTSHRQVVEDLRQRGVRFNY